MPISDPLERKRKAVELSRVSSAKGEIELKIMEYEEQIVRLKDAIKTQDAKIDELTQLLNETSEV